MSGTLNKVMLIGYIGDEVKMHYFEGGGCIARFPLATSEIYTKKSTGERIENTEWHYLVARNKLAEICERLLKKSDRIYAEGRIKTRRWQDTEGKDRYTTEIALDDFTLLTHKKQSHSYPNADQGDEQQERNRR